MIREILYFRSKSYNPRINQALETYFTEQAEAGRLIFYLWQNDKTVFIGRNQSARGECRVRELEADGGFLCRRLSGGGAVYHDTQNINFTFALHDADYDTVLQTEVILEAVRRLGLHPERSGRNDLTLDGKKFSGHSYYKNKDCRFHNGTLLVAADTKAMQRYLSVTPEKLEANKVRSVRSRVVNLRELLPDLEMEELVKALLEALAATYGVKPQPLPEEAIDRERLQYWIDFLSRPEWIYGNQREGEVQAGRRFSWGQFDLSFDLEEQRLCRVNLVSDAMEASWLKALSEALEGTAFTEPALLGVLERAPEAEETEGSSSGSRQMKEDLEGFFQALCREKAL